MQTFHQMETWSKEMFALDLVQIWTWFFMQCQCFLYNSWVFTTAVQYAAVYKRNVSFSGLDLYTGIFPAGRNTLGPIQGYFFIFATDWPIVQGQRPIGLTGQSERDLPLPPPFKFCFIWEHYRFIGEPMLTENSRDHVNTWWGQLENGKTHNYKLVNPAPLHS